MMACLHRHGERDVASAAFAEPGVKPHYAPDRQVRIEHIHLSLSIDPQQRTFSGSAVIEMKPYPAYDGRFSLDLDEVELQSIRDQDGVALDHEWGRGSVTIRSAKAPSSVTVQWRGCQPRRGLYFTAANVDAPERQPTAWTQCQDEDAHFVFPCHDHPSTKHAWTIDIDAPAGHVLLSNGRRGEESQDTNGRVRARFEQREPMPAYLVTVVVAPLTIVEDRADDVPLRYLVPPGERDHVDRAFGRTPEMVRHFAERLGVPFPWPRYDQVVVHDFVFGGMENVACATMTDALLVDEKAALAWEPDGLVAHELAHQWFGDLLTCQDWSQAWLNEGWATFMEAVWWEHHHSEDEAIWYRWRTAKGYFDESSQSYQRPIVSYDFREPIDLFDRHLYNKASCVLWTLRAELGAGAFWLGVQRYLADNLHKTVHTRHFQRAMEATTGRSLDRFFDQWLFSAGHPALKVDLSHKGDQITVTVEQTQEGADVPKAFSFALPLELMVDDRAERVVLHVDERNRSFVVKSPEGLTHVRVDPGLSVLADVTLCAPDAWLVRCLADPCPVLAVRAAFGLLETGSMSAVLAVRKAGQEHPFYGVRSQIATWLAERRISETRDWLVERLSEETDSRTAGAVATALGNYRDPVAAHALAPLCHPTSATWQLQAAALVALGRTRDSGAVEQIQEQLGTRSWVDLVRRRALAGLAETARAEVFEVLESHSRPPHTDRVRAAAALALATLADHVEPLQIKTVERLIEMLGEDGFDARFGAISGLARLRSDRGVSALSHLHRTAADGRMRRAAYDALCRIRAGRSTEAGLQSIRKRLDELVEENSKLKTRIERLEGAPK